MANKLTDQSSRRIWKNLAIVFTDILGSTRLAKKLGDNNWSGVLEAHFDQAKSLIATHNGCLIKAIGDSIMASFDSSVEALAFAMEFESATGSEKVNIRVAVHVGQVRVSKRDIFGGPVNITGHIIKNKKAKKGGIWVSSEVKRDIEMYDPTETLRWKKNGDIWLVKAKNLTSRSDSSNREVFPPKTPRKIPSSNTGDYISNVEKLAYENLYHFNDGHVKAIRLYGADDDFISEERLRLTYTHIPLVIRPALRAKITRRIKLKEDRFRKVGALFFDGPNTRLIHWRATPQSGLRAGLEENILHLQLGPIGWFDHEGLNGIIQDDPNSLTNVEAYERHTGLSKLLADQDVSASQLSNIISTATTLLTKDGFVTYSKRGTRVNMPGRLSCIAENINRYLDDADPRNSSSLVNLHCQFANALNKPDVNYKPKMVPHPFATVRRGISEELSPELLPEIGKRGSKLVGISFNLLCAHSELLFVVAVPLKKSEILEIVRRHPGKDWFEGKLNFMSVSETSIDTNHILRNPLWDPSGHASVVRTLEFIEAVKRRQGGEFD